MEKINFVNGTSPYISAENLNLLQTNIEEALTLLKLEMHPIGSIEINTSGENPSTYLGGSWIEWGSGKVPVGVDTAQTEFATVEKTGGSKTHTLTLAQIPTHNHPIKLGAGSSTGTAITYPGSETTYYNYSDIVGNAGNSQPHNNLQPYITCYMWKRIS